MFIQHCACRIHTTAQELPIKRIALQVTITSCLQHPSIISALNLNPQHGFRLDPPAHTPSQPLIPLHLSPGGAAASAIFFLTSKPAGRSASRSNMLRGGAGAACTLDLQYQVDSQAVPAAGVSEVVSEWSSRVLNDAALPLPPKQPPVAE